MPKVGKRAASLESLLGSLTPQEWRIYNYHLDSLRHGRVGRDEAGRKITVYSLGVEVPTGRYKGRFASVPGWVNDRILNEQQAYNYWADEIERGLWPIYDTA